MLITDIGIDEAGRGSVAGSMFLVGVAITNKELFYEKFKDVYIRDSKVLSSKQREHIYNLAKENIGICLQVNVQKFNANHLDKYGLSFCYEKGLNNIYNDLSKYFENPECIFDGKTLYGATNLIKPVIKADDIYYNVAIASNIAKTKRDKEVESFNEKYPEYNWNEHKGYPNGHKKYLEKYGIIKGIHRESWSTIKNLDNKFYHY